MIKQIRTSKFSKVVACYLALMIFIELTQPMIAYALTEGPSQPEFNSFTPIGTSDMVDLASGDFNYNIPIMDVGGYPINLSYNSGITMDQEASWTGLGWNLNIGQINRNVRGIPDDFKGDIIKTENNLKDNITVGASAYFNPQIIAVLDKKTGKKKSSPVSVGGGLEVQYNNYTGLRAIPSFGPTFNISENVSVGMQLSGSTETGASITPSVKISSHLSKSSKAGNLFTASLSPSITYNSRQGLQSFNLSSSVSRHFEGHDKDGVESSADRGPSGSGSISFANNTFTPVKRLAFRNNNFRLSFSFGPDIWGVHGELSLAGYGSIQQLLSKTQNQASYGYDYTDAGNTYSMLDFNRENEQGLVSKSTVALPVTNYTYDTYTIQAQGTGGTFRPFRGQVGQVYDPYVSDASVSKSVGAEAEVGGGVHIGANFRRTLTTTHTGKWGTVASPYFDEKTSGNTADYQKLYYKSVGETRVDKEYSTLINKVGKTYPVTLKIEVTKNAVNQFSRKEVTSTSESVLNDLAPFTAPIKRQHREVRNQAIQKITHAEAQKYKLPSYILTPKNPNLVKAHHTAGYIVTDENGSKNLYFDAVYNKIKKEVTFNSGENEVIPDQGLVKYYNYDNTPSNNKGRDAYFNSIETPVFAHSYLISASFSGDYEDLTADGPTDDDLGTYTKFDYVINDGSEATQGAENDYQWRVPYQRFKASYNEGIKTDSKDQKGSYLYGKRENKYLKRIVTKTHVAFFDLVPRKDAYGVDNENGGGSESTRSRMYRLKSIRLYAKPEVMKYGKIYDPLASPEEVQAKPIKTAHFVYDYSLCKHIENNLGGVEYGDDTNININEDEGKLTLRRVYFTYGESGMGKYTPYIFNYTSNDPANDNNYAYNPKAYDIWGNYKPFVDQSWLTESDQTTPQEFPYVDQNEDHRHLQDLYASAWSLKSIVLPSGGTIEVDYEADDYQYVQNKRAMQMFKVDGVTDSVSGYGSGPKDRLCGAEYDAKYVVIKLPEKYESLDYSEEHILRMFTEGLVGQSIYFNFLTNMTSGSYDYISGYFKMEEAPELSPDRHFLFIPMKKVDIENGGITSGNSNPITAAGCSFGKQNLNAQINGLDDPGGSLSTGLVSIAKSLIKNLEVMMSIFQGGNAWMKRQGCARNFMPKKSWIRLLEPSGIKVGGGCRVRKVVMHDNWDQMVDAPIGDARYAKHYGQEYNYRLENGNTSSGVATYEPNISKENPLVVPFYNRPEKMTEQTYQEKPFGSSFFPNATVTYSRVTVKNVVSGEGETKTGKIVTTHYTSYDFPTITDFTNLSKNKIYFSNENDVIGSMLKGMLGLPIEVRNDLTMAQGFVVETNDMNGRLRKQEIFDNTNILISSVEYKYNTKTGDSRALENKVTTIDELGVVRNDLEIGSSFDVVNDFRESYSHTGSYGGAANVDYFPLPIPPLYVAMVLPERSTHAQILRTAVTTKVIHRNGILKEKIVKDGSSTTYTKNHAWDAKTGQVLLTETTNDFNDQYYTLNYPAYWYYDRMGMATENLDFSATFKGNPTVVGTGDNMEFYFSLQQSPGTTPVTDISELLKLGDEIVIEKEGMADQLLWVTGYNANKTAVSLMTRMGYKVHSLATYGSTAKASFRVLRSGNRNCQTATMATIVLMKNPLLFTSPTEGTINHTLLNYNGLSGTNPMVINASAVEYNDLWYSQCENGLPRPQRPDINEYVYNIRGDWRPSASLAFLTGRKASTTTNIRNAGFFKNFNPFYKKQNADWIISGTNWTTASTITKFNPYGAEIENKDALHRYSSAQYGYGYKLPVAVASNAQYKEIGFDGFEDYRFDNYDPAQWLFPGLLKTHFGFNEGIQLDKHVTNMTSHTGKKSIVLSPRTSIQMKRKIEPCAGE